MQRFIFFLDIIEELPHLATSNVSTSNGPLMRIIKFSDLKDSWAPEDVLNTDTSKSLLRLANKIEDMVERGRANDVEPMLKSIISGKIKVWNDNDGPRGRRNKRREKKQNYKVIEFKYPENDQRFNCGEQNFIYGHFRWDFGAYLLNELELRRIKNYFNL